MALAIRMENLIHAGGIIDYSQLAQLAVQRKLTGPWRIHGRLYTVSRQPRPNRARENRNIEISDLLIG
jgi:hypothetical protein